jgi:hypothetical protein
MQGLSLPVILVLVGAALALPGMRGLLDIRAALRSGELGRLGAPLHWLPTRAFVGFVAAVPVYAATASMGIGALGAMAVTASLGFAVAPLFLDSLRRRATQALLDELALHLDLIALAMESGSSLTSALHACAERAPEGPLRRAWARAVLDIHAGAEVVDVLKELDRRHGCRPGVARAGPAGRRRSLRTRGATGPCRTAQAVGHAGVVHRAVHPAGAGLPGGAAAGLDVRLVSRRAAGA